MAIIISAVLAATAFSYPCAISAKNNENPVIKGSFADPDIDVFGCKYWIYPTTDGSPGWSGTQFHAFSSENLIDWNDEGVILDVADDNPSLNEKGIQIASSAWSCGNAWAPTIEKKGNKYYFYYCGRIKEELLEKYGYKDKNGNYMGDKAIGVAVSDNPAGPFVAKDEPLLYPKLLGESEYLKKEFGGQIIDPSIFTDDDGKSYILFGNGNAYMYQLSDNMVSVEESTLRQLELNDFRESVVLFKRGGIYHFTWSCDDTGSVNYHVNYGTARTLTQTVTNRGTILEKNENEAIFGTGHQCTLYLPDTDECYIAYARHQTKDGVSVSDPGNFREVCITELEFSGAYLKPAVPSNSAVSPREIHRWNGGTITATTSKSYTKTFVCTLCGEKKEIIYNKAANTLTAKGKPVTLKVKTLKKKSITVTRSKAVAVSGAKGTVTYSKSSGNAKITVNKKNGNITVKKGLKKGIYKIKIKVTAAGNSTVKSAVKTVTVTIKIK